MALGCVKGKPRALVAFVVAAMLAALASALVPTQASAQAPAGTPSCQYQSDVPVAKRSAETDPGKEIVLGCSDPEGDALTYELRRPPRHGSLSSVDPSSGIVTYTPASGYSGPDRFTFRARDSTGQYSNVAMIRVRVGRLAEPPALDAISGRVTDYQGNPLQGIIVRAVPRPPRFGCEQPQSYAVTDASGNYTVHLRPPVLCTTGNSGELIAPPTTWTRVSFHDDLSGLPAGTPLGEIKEVCDPLNPAVCVRGPLEDRGQWATEEYPQWVPIYPGLKTEGIDAALEPLAGLPNRAPACENQSGIGVEYERGEQIELSCSDSDADNTLSYAIVEGPEHGTLSGPDAFRRVTYTPDAGYSGPDGFTFRATDNEGASSEAASVSLTVGPAGQSAPSCLDQSDVAVLHESAKPLALECSDPNARDTLSYAIVSQPEHGTLSEPDSSGRLTYTPAAGYAGPDGFSFRASDQRGFSSNTASVSLDVAPAGDRAPVCAEQSAAVGHEQPKEITLGCTDPDSGDPIAHELVDQPKHGTLSALPIPVEIDFNFELSDVACPSASQCTAVDIYGRQITFDPSAPGSRPVRSMLDEGVPLNAIECPSTRQCTAVNDRNQQFTFDPTAPPADPVPVPLAERGDQGIKGLACPSTTLCVTVGPTLTFDPTDPASPPRAVAGPPPGAVVGGEIGALACPSVTQCTDNLHQTFDPTNPDEPSDDVGGWKLTSFGDARKLACPSVRQCTALFGTGQAITYDPREVEDPGNPNNPGPHVYAVSRSGRPTDIACPSEIQCIAIDDGGNMASFNPRAPQHQTFVVIDADRKPSALACPTINQCTAVEGAGNIGSQGRAGRQVTFNRAGQDPSGRVTYMPVDGYGGPDSFRFRAFDGHSARSNTAKVSLSVAGNGDSAPVCEEPARVAVAHGQAKQIALGCSDPDPGATLSYAIVDPPAHGTLSTPDAAGNVTYTPQAGYAGRDSFSFKATDNTNKESNTASVPLNVDMAGDGGTNAAPSCQIQSNVAVAHNTAKQLTLGCTDPDAGDTFSIAIVSQPQHGTLSSPDSSGRVTYTPNSGYSGPDSFAFKATDNHGAASNTATVSLNVAGPPANAAPSCQNQNNVAVAHNTPKQITLGCTDPNAGDTLTYSVVSQPQHGTLSAPNSAGQLTYTPTSGYSGADSFTFKATDNHNAASNTATVNLNVAAAQPGNAAPSCQDQTNVAVAHNTQKQITLGCSDPDPGDTLTYAIVSQPAHGTVSTPDSSGQVTYTPTSRYAGTDSFTFKATDNHNAASNTASVSLSVATAPTRPPPGNDNGGGNGGANGAPAEPAGAIVASALSVSPKVFQAEGSGPAVKSAQQKGTTVSFELNQAADVVFTVQRRGKGRKVRRAGSTRCARQTTRNRSKRRCVRYTRKGSFTIKGLAGQNRFHFTGRVGGRKLPPGRYRLVATPRAGQVTGTAAKTSFRIVR